MQRERPTGIQAQICYTELKLPGFMHREELTGLHAREKDLTGFMQREKPTGIQLVQSGHEKFYAAHPTLPAPAN